MHGDQHSLEPPTVPQTLRPGPINVTTTKVGHVTQGYIEPRITQGRNYVHILQFLKDTRGKGSKQTKTTDTKRTRTALSRKMTILSQALKNHESEEGKLQYGDEPYRLCLSMIVEIVKDII